MGKMHPIVTPWASLKNLSLIKGNYAGSGNDWFEVPDLQMQAYIKQFLES